MKGEARKYLFDISEAIARIDLHIATLLNSTD